jgi:hypothetical protein
MVYSFYPIRADGASMAFDVAELAGPRAARAYAQKVLTRHASAIEVAIWAGERAMGSVRRLAPEAA